MQHICDLRSSFGWLQSQSRRSCDWHKHVEWRHNSSLAAYQTCCRTLHRPEVLLQAHYIGSFWCIGHFPCFCLVQHRWFFCDIFLPQQPLKSCYEKRLVMPCHAMAPLSQVLLASSMASANSVSQFTFSLEDEWRLGGIWRELIENGWVGFIEIFKGFKILRSYISVLPSRNRRIKRHTIWKLLYYYDQFGRHASQA